MKVKAIIEKAEKYRLLGRFDRDQAIDYINDCIYEIVERQGLTKTYVKTDFDGNDIEIPNDRLIRIEGVYIEKAEEFDRVKYQINPEITVSIYHIPSETEKYVKATPSSYPELTSLTIEYLGFTPCETVESDLPIDSKFSSALMYYLRAKMLEETDQIERASYFIQQFTYEMMKKIQPYKTPIAKPNEFSLL